MDQPRSPVRSTCSAWLPVLGLGPWDTHTHTQARGNWPTSGYLQWRKMGDLLSHDAFVTQHVR